MAGAAGSPDVPPFFAVELRDRVEDHRVAEAFELGDQAAGVGQELKVGDRVLDGAPDKHCALVVAQLERNRHLVLHSCEHLPGEWQERYGDAVDWSWQFVLNEWPAERTRFLFRSRLHLEPPWVEAFYLAVIVRAEFVMSRQMLHGVKRRAERTTSEDLASLAVARELA